MREEYKNNTKKIIISSGFLIILSTTLALTNQYSQPLSANFQAILNLPMGWAALTWVGLGGLGLLVIEALWSLVESLHNWCKNGHRPPTLIRQGILSNSYTYEEDMNSESRSSTINEPNEMPETRMQINSQAVELKAIQTYAPAITDFFKPKPSKEQTYKEMEIEERLNQLPTVIVRMIFDYYYDNKEEFKKLAQEFEKLLPIISGMTFWQVYVPTNPQYTSSVMASNITYAYEVLRAFAHNEKVFNPPWIDYRSLIFPHYQKGDSNEVVDIFFQYQAWKPTGKIRLFDHFCQRLKDLGTKKDVEEPIHLFFHKLYYELRGFIASEQNGDSSLLDEAFGQFHKASDFSITQ